MCLDKEITALNVLCLKSSFASHGYDQTKRLAGVQMQADISCQGNGSILACATHTSTIGVTFHRNGSIRVEGEEGSVTDPIP